MTNPPLCLPSNRGLDEIHKAAADLLPAMAALNMEASVPC
jgi:hypothetical protein